MAAKTTTAVGSAPWISMEQENVIQMLQQEKEELIYPAQHEMQWLNEHMTEIFSRNEFAFTEVFKTPGKLRGKTPRTARKGQFEEARVPLSDVFSSHPPTSSPAKYARLSKHAPNFTIAKDLEQFSKQNIPKSQADSGYHGSSQDTMEIDIPQSIPDEHVPIPPMTEQQGMTLNIPDVLSQERRTTEGSFHSAKEEQTAKIAADALKPVGQSSIDDRGTAAIGQQSQSLDQSVAGSAPQDMVHPEYDDIGSPSDESTPDRPLIRKSSLTFAALPAREPLKGSIGARVSRTSHIDPSKSLGTERASYRERHTGGHRTTSIHDSEDVPMSEDENIEILGRDDSEDDTRKLHSKSSTQRLHEKINMLGKAPPPRPSKSIPSTAAIAAAHTIQSEVDRREERKNQAEDDDEWIKPPITPQKQGRPSLVKSHTADVMEGLTTGVDDGENDDQEFDLRAPELIAHEERLRTPLRTSPTSNRPKIGFGHAKSASTVTLASPEKQLMGPPLSPARTIEVSNPSQQTTTPRGSPKRWHEGPLSASKSKLQSIMKTAKGLFSSSASVSAAAKMEMLSPRALQMATRTMPGLYPSLSGLLEDKPLPASPREGRRTRSSSEKEKMEQKNEKAAKAMQKMEDKLEQAREQERHKVAQQKRGQVPVSSPRKVLEKPGVDECRDIAEVAQPSLPQPNSKISRSTRPVRDNAPRPKPQPVSIRVGTLSQRVPSALASGTAETLNTEPKRPGMSKKTSTTSLQSASSSTTFKATSSAQPTKPRALVMAERKREQDEKEVQRKIQLKKDMERKRAAQQEEARKREQAQRADEERKERERIAAEQAKRQAQQQAIEQKRLEAAKKAEEQRLERAVEVPARPPSRLGAQAMNRSLINHPLPTNPAKPPKRHLEEEVPPSRPQAPRFGAASQQADAKRRKTEDEGNLDPPPRPTMSGAPIRQSHLGKKPSIFTHSAYTAVPLTQPHPAQMQSQMQQFPQPPNVLRTHPNAMAQYATGAKIPFADATNPPNPPVHSSKTPISSHQPPPKTLQLVKSSPQYPNGDAIHLPEIPTDSEDEDSDNEGNAFPIPDWATPNHLTEQLIRQEGMDGDAVFGPIAPLKMEEIFAKGNKERLKRMRERTSSANWAMSGDGLTLEEVRHDREQREKMRLEGGWRYAS